jgi:chorismate mutase/prephenate dehydratase
LHQFRGQTQLNEAVGHVGDVFDFLSSRPDALGIVPIENSSGGFIIDTVDRLVDDRCPLWIQEELTLDVKLALLGHSGAPVEVIYSHPMPFFHADEWLKAHYPTARRVTRPSTAASAELAAAEPNAIASRILDLPQPFSPIKTVTRPNSIDKD